MALIPCAKCGRQISSFAKACPACGTPPQIGTVPPPLPAPAARFTDTDAFVVKLAIVIGLLVVAGIATNIFNKPESRTASVPSSSAPVPATTPQRFPRTFLRFIPRPTPQSFPRAIPVQTPPAFGVDVPLATPAPVTYRVIKISHGDYLNVRAGAGSKYPVVLSLEPDTGGIVLGANRVANAETMWQEIIVNGRTGWVNADYIAPVTQPPASP
jgi:hypothetical protein